MQQNIVCWHTTRMYVLILNYWLTEKAAKHIMTFTCATKPKTVGLSKWDFCKYYAKLHTPGWELQVCVHKNSLIHAYALRKMCMYVCDWTCIYYLRTWSIMQRVSLYQISKYFLGFLSWGSIICSYLMRMWCLAFFSGRGGAWREPVSSGLLGKRCVGRGEVSRGGEEETSKGSRCPWTFLQRPLVIHSKRAWWPRLRGLLLEALSRRS